MSDKTIWVYELYLKRYFDLLPVKAAKPLISENHLRNILGEIAIESYSIKKNIFTSIMSFTKFLVLKGKFKDDDREKLRKLRPKRFLPPKKTSLTRQQIDKLLEETNKLCGRNAFDRQVTRLIMLFVVNTGLRVSELINLKLNDVDLEKK